MSLNFFEGYINIYLQNMFHMFCKITRYYMMNKIIANFSKYENTPDINRQLSFFPNCVDYHVNVRNRLKSLFLVCFRSRLMHHLIVGDTSACITFRKGPQAWFGHFDACQWLRLTMTIKRDPFMSLSVPFIVGPFIVETFAVYDQSQRRYMYMS